MKSTKKEDSKVGRSMQKNEQIWDGIVEKFFKELKPSDDGSPKKKNEKNVSSEIFLVPRRTFPRTRKRTIKKRTFDRESKKQTVRTLDFDKSN